MARRQQDYASTCSQKVGFRADHLDALVWDWVRELFTHPEATLKGMRKEQAELTVTVAALTISDEQIESVVRIAEELSEWLHEAEQDFQKRRELIEELDLTARLAIETGKKVVHISCLAGESRPLSVAHTTSFP